MHASTDEALVLLRRLPGAETAGHYYELLPLKPHEGAVALQDRQGRCQILYGPPGSRCVFSDPGEPNFLEAMVEALNFADLNGYIRTVFDVICAAPREFVASTSQGKLQSASGGYYRLAAVQSGDAETGLQQIVYGPVLRPTPLGGPTAPEVLGPLASALNRADLYACTRALGDLAAHDAALTKRIAAIWSNAGSRQEVSDGQG